MFSQNSFTILECKGTFPKISVTDDAQLCISFFISVAKYQTFQTDGDGKTSAGHGQPYVNHVTFCTQNSCKYQVRGACVLKAIKRSLDRFPVCFPSLSNATLNEVPSPQNLVVGGTLTRTQPLTVCWPAKGVSYLSDSNQEKITLVNLQVLFFLHTG